MTIESNRWCQNCIHIKALVIIEINQSIIPNCELNADYTTVCIFHVVMVAA